MYSCMLNAILSTTVNISTAGFRAYFETIGNFWKLEKLHGVFHKNFIRYFQKIQIQSFQKIQM